MVGHEKITRLFVIIRMQERVFHTIHYFNFSSRGAPPSREQLITNGDGLIVTLFKMTQDLREGPDKKCFRVS